MVKRELTYLNVLTDMNVLKHSKHTSKGILKQNNVGNKLLDSIKTKPFHIHVFLKNINGVNSLGIEIFIDNFKFAHNFRENLIYTFCANNDIEYTPYYIDYSKFSSCTNSKSTTISIVADAKEEEFSFDYIIKDGFKDTDNALFKIFENIKHTSIEVLEVVLDYIADAQNTVLFYNVSEDGSINIYE